jgi:hypothetical protein
MNKKLILVTVFLFVFFLVGLQEVKATACFTDPECGGRPWVCVGADYPIKRGTCKQPDGNPDHCFLGINCVPPDECIADVCYVSTDPVPTLPPIDYVPVTCSAGQSLSCGTATEAATQNKMGCTYRKTCNKYFFPSTIGFPAPCSVKNPVSATCYSNCSCCPSGTSRSCTLGVAYTKDVLIDIAGDSVANEAAKVTCNGTSHGDFLRDLANNDPNPRLVSEYCDRWGCYENWRLFCITIEF